MAFARRPNETEVQAARSAQAGDPSNTLTDSRAVVSLRRGCWQLCRDMVRCLDRMRTTFDAVGAAALEAELTTPEYNDFIADYNAVRTTVLQLDPAAVVPAALP